MNNLRNRLIIVLEIVASIFLLVAFYTLLWASCFKLFVQEQYYRFRGIPYYKHRGVFGDYLVKKQKPVDR